MRIIIITQDEPFYLAENLKYLISIFPKHSQIVGCIVNDVSPFGKKETFLQKVRKTYDTFGSRFFVHYAKTFVLNKFNSSKKVLPLLRKNKIAEIKLQKPINHKDSVEKIKSFKPDLLVSILGNQIFKDPIINLAPKGCINLHTALLPKYRGLMPTFWVLKNNEEYTGVSVFYVEKGIDSGPIIVQKKVEIGDRSQEGLIKLTKKLGMEAIAKAVDLIEKDNVRLMKNNPSEKTYYSFPTKEDVKIFKKKGKKFF